MAVFFERNGRQRIEDCSRSISKKEMFGYRTDCYSWSNAYHWRRQLTSVLCLVSMYGGIDGPGKITKNGCLMITAFQLPGGDAVIFTP